MLSHVVRTRHHKVGLVALLATVLVAISAFLFPEGALAQGNPPPVQLYYVPVPEDQGFRILDSIDANGGIRDVSVPVFTYVSVAVAQDDTRIYYDQWENGYDQSLTNPADLFNNGGACGVPNPGGTQVWGDGDPCNGSPPADDGNDLLGAGEVLVLSSTISDTTPAGLQNVIDFDGRDRIGSTRQIAVSRAFWASGTDTLLAFALEVYPTYAWGTTWQAPVGEDTIDGPDGMFEYTALTIQADTQTVVDIDKDGDGIFEVTGATLSQGESFHLHGGVNQGAAVKASVPVQVHLVTGDIDSAYEIRGFTMFPVDKWANSYFNPVGVQKVAPAYLASGPTRIFLFNPGPADLLVKCDLRAASQTIGPITQRDTGTVDVPNGSGAHCYAVDSSGTLQNQPFMAVVTVDSHPGGTQNGQNWDWGMTLVPETALTPQVLNGIGLGRDPNSTVAPDQNGSPVWITPACTGAITSTYVYVDYDGDGTADKVDLNGNNNVSDTNVDGLDETTSDRGMLVFNLQSVRLRRFPFVGDLPDQTGIQISTLTGPDGAGDLGCDLAAAWGEDPTIANSGNPGFDVGTTGAPLRLSEAGKTVDLAVDRDGNGQIGPGDRVTYTISILNTGRARLGNLVVRDTLPDNVAYVPNSSQVFDDTNSRFAITDGGASAFPLDEGGVNLQTVIGRPLPVGKSWSVSFLAEIDPTPGLCKLVVVNVASVAVPDLGEELPLVIRTQLVCAPAVRVEKATNGVDADDPPGPLVVEAGPVTWTYVVTNTGLITLTNLSLDDTVLGTIPGSACVGGSIPDELGPGQSFVCTITARATSEQYMNKAIVSGSSLISSTQIVTDEDVSHYFGVDAAVDIEKLTNGQDADTPPGPSVPVGAPVTWTYRVENTGDITLSNISIVDSVIGSVACQEGPVPSLAPGAVFICTVSGTASAGQYVNTGIITAQPVDEQGNPLIDSSGQPVSVRDQDTSHYYGAQPAVDIEKLTNGQDADTPPGPSVPEGAPVTWTYRVENTGDITLSNISIVDSVIGSVACQEGPVPSLAPGAVFICTVTGTASTGQYVNTGVITAQPVDEQGNPLIDSSGQPVSVRDQDTSHYYGAQPAVDIEKLTNGQDADTPPGPSVPVGAPVTWTYLVENTGDITLSNISIVDSVLGIVTCQEGPIPALAPGAVFDCTVSGTASAGQYVNTGIITAQPVDEQGNPLIDSSGQPVSVRDQDTSHYFGVDPAIDIEKTIYLGHDGGASCPGSEKVTGSIGSPVTYCFVVTNIGRTYLDNIRLDDPTLGIQLTGNVLLAPQESTTLYYETTISGALINTASVEAIPSDSQGNEIPGSFIPTDSDTAQVNVVGKIGDTVWQDLDGDGLQDDDEPGVPQVEVKLFDESGQEIATTKTDLNGQYMFENVPAGNYYLVFGPPDAGYYFSPTDVGADDTIDSDAHSDPAVPDYGFTELFYLAPGEITTRWDAGIVAPPDLRVVKEATLAGGDVARPGEAITYTIAYSNTGLSDATGVVITETVPLYTMFDPDRSTPGWTCENGGVTAGTACTFVVGTVRAGERSSTDIVFVVHVTGPLDQVVRIINHVSIGDDDAFGEVPGAPNNQDIEETQVSWPAALDTEAQPNAPQRSHTLFLPLVTSDRR